MRAAYNVLQRGTARPARAYRHDKNNWLAGCGAHPTSDEHMVRILISTARRLALKIASYGVMHLVVAVLVAFAITRDWRLAR